MVYTTTSGGCGGAPNAVWALDLTAERPAPVTWKTGGPDLVGTSGVALGSDGTLYAALPDAVVALDRITLAVKHRFTAEGAGLNTSPTVVRHKGRDLVVVSSRNGRLYLLDGASLGGTDDRTPLDVVEAGRSPGAGLATWDDGTTRWVLAPTSGAGTDGPGAIVAFKVVDRAAGFALEKAWQSRELVSPLAPIVVNGVVFAASSSPAVLYALDGATGRELWSSGSIVTSPARAGLSAGGGQVYLVTQDNTLYAFGIPLEH
jgi:outer membrane protein assembly factor BamB